MIEVEPLHEGDRFKTDVWAATDQVLGAMVKLAKRKRELVMRFKKLVERCAKVGFEVLSTDLLRNEANAVYALGERNGPLTRAAGFFHDGQSKETFVLIRFFEKHATKPRENEKENCRRVARVRDDGDWVLVRKEK